MENPEKRFTGLQVSEQTMKCILSMKSYFDRGEKATAGIIFGMPAVGKSSLAESITGMTGLSGDSLEPVTTKCNIVETSIGARPFFLIDTPPFEDEHGAKNTFLKIMEVVDAIRPFVTFSSVLYVVDIGRSHDAGFDAVLRDWLAAFCGEDFFPHLTLVTTFWDSCDTSEFQALERRLASRKIQWSRFLNRGARTYQHGKIYENGIETASTLSWATQKDELANQARIMVSQNCGLLPAVQPQTIQELNEHVPFERISAANILSTPRQTKVTEEEPMGGSPMADALDSDDSPTSSTAEYTHNQERQERGSNHSDPYIPSGAADAWSEAEHENESDQTSSRSSAPSDDRHGEEAGAAETVNEPNFWSNLCSKIVENFQVQITPNSIQIGLGGVRYRHDLHGGPGRNTYPNNGPGGSGNLNTTESIVDALKYHGQPSDMSARKVLAATWEVNAGPDGSEEQNDALLRELKARVKRNGGRWCE